MGLFYNDLWYLKNRKVYLVKYRAGLSIPFLLDYRKVLFKNNNNTGTSTIFCVHRSLTVKQTTYFKDHSVLIQIVNFTAGPLFFLIKPIKPYQADVDN